MWATDSGPPGPQCGCKPPSSSRGALELSPDPSQPFVDVGRPLARAVGAVARARIRKGVVAVAAAGTLLFKPNDSLTRTDATAVALRVCDYLKGRGSTGSARVVRGAGD